MIPAWSDARKMVRRASRLTEDGEDSDRSEASSPRHTPTAVALGGQRRAKSASGLTTSSSPILHPTRSLSKQSPLLHSAHPPSSPSPIGPAAAANGGDAGYGSFAEATAPPPLSEVKEPHLHQQAQTKGDRTLAPTSAPSPSHAVHFPDSPHPTLAKPPPLAFTLSSDLHTLWSQLSSSPFLSSLLLFCPLGLAAPIFGFPDLLQFLTNFLCIIPLAWLLGMVTEEIALRTSQTLGALLNATFGNAVELIVSIVALRKGFVRLVQTSLLGSVLSNLLLVLGMSFLLGGLRYEHQVYNRKGAQIFASMLLLACLALAVPSAYVNAFDAEVNIADILDISRITAVIIFAVYLLYLYFQLYTHTDMFREESPRAAQTPHSIDHHHTHHSHHPHHPHHSTLTTHNEDGYEDEEEVEDDDEPEEPLISLSSALLLLLLITLLISFCSDNLIDSIAPVTRAWNINESFVGIILLPIVGNAAEHATAVTCALKNKLDLSIGVAVGSSTQIALFVIPFVTLLGWAIGQPMTLNFSEFEMIVLVMSVLIVNFLVKVSRGHTHPQPTPHAPASRSPAPYLVLTRLLSVRCCVCGCGGA